MQEHNDPPSVEPPPGAGGAAEAARKQRSRREFLTLVTVGLGGLGAAIVAVPFVGALIAPLLRPEPGEWRPVGAVNSFKVGETTSVAFQDSSPLAWAGPAANTAAWLRRTSEQQFQAFSVNCTHLGCPVRWLQDAGLFMCPCHGGVYYADGRVAAGPPEKPLFLYPVRINNGQVEIQTSAVPIT